MTLDYLSFWSRTCVLSNLESANRLTPSEPLSSNRKWVLLTPRFHKYPMANIRCTSACHAPQYVSTLLSERLAPDQPSAKSFLLLSSTAPMSQWRADHFSKSPYSRSLHWCKNRTCLHFAAVGVLYCVWLMICRRHISSAIGKCFRLHGLSSA